MFSISLIKPKILEPLNKTYFKITTFFIMFSTTEQGVSGVIIDGYSSKISPYVLISTVDPDR